MNSIDRELSQMGQGWSNAGGTGSCIAKCNLLHPFNKSKRSSCQTACGTSVVTAAPVEEVVTAAPVAEVAPTVAPEVQSGISTKAIVIGASSLLVIGLVIYLIKRKK